MDTNIEEKLLGHFGEEFTKGSLANIKFFVLPGRVSVSQLAEEICQYEEAAKKGLSKGVTSIDGNCPKTRFDAPFV